MNKVLIIGNQGYIGPVLQKHLSKKFILFGYDIGYFSNNLSTVFDLGIDSNLKCQYYGDVRNIKENLFENIDHVVYLAAISNDPMGNLFGNETNDINKISALKCANFAKNNGVKSFVFASSCSVYGTGGSSIKNEESILNPLTPYAKSKIESEEELSKISSDAFKITCLRFATACGASPRLRLDLVLNDFVASAVLTNKIEILSDGTPWRPIIDVKDMSKAIEWAITERNNNPSNNFIALNIGSNEWNFTIKELADEVGKIIKGTKISINKNAQPDKRSYKVDFSLYYNYAKIFYPKRKIETTVSELIDNIDSIIIHKNFRNSQYIRLVHLKKLIDSKIITKELKFL